MKNKWKKFAILLWGVLFLTGCHQKKIQSLAVVTAVDITCCRGEQVLVRYYSQPEKVRRVLTQLRRCNTQGFAACDPERVIGDVFWIRVHLSDGKSHVYRQRADRFLSRDCRRWKNIEESRGRRLYYLMWAMPPDPNPVAKETVS